MKGHTMTEQIPETDETEEVIEIDLNPEADEETTEDDPETFPKAYVVKLRDENAKYRQKAADRDDVAQRLHAALVAATGRLADPSDLTFDDEHLTDPEALTTALDDLLTRKPHLASRRVVGDVGQGAGKGDTAVDLAGMLRRNAS
jgi:hypothetical protein